MKKEILGYVKLEIEAGKANPAPPIGPALGQKGVNIMAFCNDFNAKTKDKSGPLPILLTVYKDKSYDMIIKCPSVVSSIKKELNLKSGSKLTGQIFVAEINTAQAKKIAESKMQDMNCFSLDSAIRMVIGTARSMGIKYVD
jgi:large subunit ribosomal protein L11